jgi:hypothetical protein
MDEHITVHVDLHFHESASDGADRGSPSAR